MSNYATVRLFGLPTGNMEYNHNPWPHLVEEGNGWVRDSSGLLIFREGEHLDIRPTKGYVAWVYILNDGPGDLLIDLWDKRDEGDEPREKTFIGEYEYSDHRLSESQHIRVCVEAALYQTTWTTHSDNTRTFSPPVKVR